MIAKTSPGLERAWRPEIGPYRLPDFHADAVAPEAWQRHDSRVLCHPYSEDDHWRGGTRFPLRHRHNMGYGPRHGRVARLAAVISVAHV